MEIKGTEKTMEIKIMEMMMNMEDMEKKEWG